MRDLRIRSNRFGQGKGLAGKSSSKVWDRKSVSDRSKTQ